MAGGVRQNRHLQTKGRQPAPRSLLGAVSGPNSKDELLGSPRGMELGPPPSAPWAITLSMGTQGGM